jgi:hypothetical protein
MVLMRLASITVLSALVTALSVSMLRAQQVQQPTIQPGSRVPASCPVTNASGHRFTPPSPYDSQDLGKGGFWLGSEKLWISLSEPAIWDWEPHKPGHEHQVQPLTQKLFWMSVDYDWRKEPQPDITVTGRRLDGTAPPLLLLPATHAIGEPLGAMLTGVYVPTPGCWEITGEYKGEKLSFVVWVKPARQ